MALATPTLGTARLRLRPFDQGDAAAVYDLMSNAAVLRYWDEPPWRDPARAARFLAKCQLLAEDGVGVRLAVEHGDAFLGWLGLSRWDDVYLSAGLTVCFAEAHWGQGYATEATRALLAWAYDTSNLNRVQAETDTRNAACARMLEKVGFLREGTLREDCIVNGEVSDSWVWGLLRRDWTADVSRG